MDNSTKELLGSLSWVAKAECDPAFERKVRKLFRSICRKQCRVQVNIVCAGNLTFDLHRKIDELILENKGDIVKGKR